MQTMKQWFAEFSDEQKNLVLRDFLVCMLNSREHEYLKGHGDLTVLQKSMFILLAYAWITNSFQVIQFWINKKITTVKFIT